MIRGGFRGGGGRGGADAPPPSGIRPPADPKGPPFDTFSEIHFWPTDSKIFLKAPLAPIYTNFEGERAPKKTLFFCQNFSKSAQKRLFWLFFQKFACGAQNFSKIGAKQCFGRARKTNLVDLKKKKRSSKFWKIFWKSAPPRENPRSAPGDDCKYIKLSLKLWSLFVSCRQPVALFFFHYFTTLLCSESSILHE